MVLQWNYCNLPFNMIIAKKKKGFVQLSESNDFFLSFKVKINAKWKLVLDEKKRNLNISTNFFLYK